MLVEISLAQYTWQFGAMLALLAASGFFSGTETAMFSLGRRDLNRLEKSVSGRVAVRLLARPRRLLTSLLLSNMVVNVSYSATAAMIVISIGESGSPGWLVAAATVAPLLLLILVGEVAPKMVAFGATRAWTRAAALPVSAIERVLRPLISFMDTVIILPLTRIITPRDPRSSDITQEELAALMEISTRRGSIPVDAGEMLQEIVELTDLKVCDIMVPRVDMITFPIDGDPADLADLFRQTGLRKVPVLDGDRIVGAVHAKRLLLKADTPPRELLRPVLFIPELATLEKALIQFRVNRVQLAVAVDEYGSTAGLVTVEDILEEIVGEIRDRHEADEPEPVIRCGENEYLVAGDLAIHDWAGAFDITETVGRRIHTIGGLAASLLGRIPRAGDEVTWRNLSMRIESVSGRRVGSIRLHLGGQEQ